MQGTRTAETRLDKMLMPRPVASFHVDEPVIHRGYDPSAANTEKPTAFDYHRRTPLPVACSRQ